MSDKLKIVYRPLKDLTPYARNARTHNDVQVNQVVVSIKEFGWTNPILIDENAEIIAGHGRVLAAEQLAFDVVPCITLSGLSEAQKRAYRLADNKLPLSAGWDEVLLKTELRELADGEFDLTLTGFGDDELSALLGEGQEIDFDKDEDSGGIDINYLAFARKKIPMTESEMSGLLNALNDYVEENGSLFGFVSHLIGGEEHA